MSYDHQYHGYAPEARPYYNQPPPPRNASRGVPLQDRYQQPRNVNGYGAPPQERYQQAPQNSRVESYVGYDDGDILDQYGTDEQDYQQSGYSYCCST